MVRFLNFQSVAMKPMILACASSALILSGCDSSNTVVSGINDIEFDYFDERTDSLLLSRLDDTTPPRLASAVEEPATITRTSASRFLQQTSFGATPETMEAVQLNGLEGWIDQQMQMSSGPSLFDRYAERTSPRTLDPEDEQFGALVGAEWITPVIWQAWIEAPDQLRMRVAAALMEIFVVTARVDAIGIFNNQRTAASYADMLEANAFGNFRDILYSTSKHPAMAHYLTFVNNRKAKYGANGDAVRVPDENYAREILQLFSIGLYELKDDGTRKISRNGKPIETYKQSDIFNLARVFTGWSVDNSLAYPYTKPLMLVPEWHSPEEKKFLGLTIPANTGAQRSMDLAIDQIFNHPNVGPFIGKQLIQRLVTSNPSPAYVKRVTQAFNNSGGVRGDLSAVVKAILLDPEARNPNGTTVSGKVREPMFRLTAVARLLGDRPALDYYPITDLGATTHALGQSPMQSPSVFNFFQPGYTPLGSKLAAGGFVAPEFQIVSGSAIPGSINLINDYIANADARLMIRTWPTLTDRTSGSGVRLINWLALILTGKSITKAERTTMAEVIDSLPDDDIQLRLRVGLHLVTSHPKFFIQR